MNKVKNNDTEQIELFTSLKNNSNVKMTPCKLCGKDTPEGNIYCHECFWKTKWPEYIINSPELASRRKRSHLVKLKTLDIYAPSATFYTSKNNGEEHFTTLKTCTCKDFAMGRGNYPCKHIFRLAEELGLFHCEHFAPNEKDYTFTEHSNDKLYIRQSCLPEQLLCEEEKLIEKYVTLLYFIVKGCKKEQTLWVNGERQNSKLVKKPRYKTLSDALKAREKLSFTNKDDELLDKLENLGLIKTLDLASVTRENAKKRHISVLSKQMPLHIAEKIVDAFHGIYPPAFLHNVTQYPLPLLNNITKTLKRSEYLLRPHDASDTLDWAFYVPEYFNSALDIQLVTRENNLIEYTVWTQGANFSFDVGDMLYRDAETYRQGKPALQIIAAEPACGVQVEKLKEDNDIDDDKLFTEKVRKNEKRINNKKEYDAGNVTYKNFETDEIATVTQFDFVKMLMGV